MDKDIPILDVDYHLREYDETAEQVRERLFNGPGGIMEMKQTIADKETEIERLKEKCDKQAMMLRRLLPEKFPDTLFISGVLGKRDQNNMPESITVCPAFGVDFSYVYQYTGRTIGGMGS